MKFARPVNDSTPNITNPFSATHKGTDYGYPDGTPIYASESGKVTLVKKDEVRQWLANTASDPFKPTTGTRVLRTEDYGNFVKIDHGDGYETLYAHHKVNSTLISVGQQVTKGQQIAQVGSTGNSSGNHSHWEIRKNGVVIDPLPLLDTTFTAYGSNQTPPINTTQGDALASCLSDREKFWKERDEARETAKNLNTMVTQKDGELQTANSEIGELKKQLISKDQTMNTLQEQADRVPNLEQELAQAIQDRKVIIDAESTYKTRITNLEKEIKRIEDDWFAAFVAWVTRRNNKKEVN